MWEKSLPYSKSFGSSQKRWERVQERRNEIQQRKFYKWRAKQFVFW